MTLTFYGFIAVLAAAVAAFAFGAFWYRLLGRHWMRAVGMSEPPKPSPAPFLIGFVAELLIAYFLAGLVAHIGPVTLQNGVVTGFFVWLAFVATTLLVNHRYQGSPWLLTLIDGGHWLGVFVIIGLVVGIFGPLS